MDALMHVVIRAETASPCGRVHGTLAAEMFISLFDLQICRLLRSTGVDDQAATSQAGHRQTDRQTDVRAGSWQTRPFVCKLSSSKSFRDTPGSWPG